MSWGGHSHHRATTGATRNWGVTSFSRSFFGTFIWGGQFTNDEDVTVFDGISKGLFWELLRTLNCLLSGTNVNLVRRGGVGLVRHRLVLDANLRG